ncbi:MAG: 6-carboxytetrahydropterin synthase [Deltaproteobacteria bacterium]|nr:6-carboxytetrahydropterin synthase [Deltaproteobacteria bacterium]
MYEVTVKRSFSAAHALAIGGKCEQLHGHNFGVEVTIGSADLSPEGLVIDFRLLKAWLDEIIGNLDHRFLNDVPVLRGTNPTSEHIAKHIFDCISGRQDLGCLRVISVTVSESDNSRATYRGDWNG